MLWAKAVPLQKKMFSVFTHKKASDQSLAAHRLDYLLFLTT